MTQLNTDEMLKRAEEVLGLSSASTRGRHININITQLAQDVKALVEENARLDNLANEVVEKFSSCVDKRVAESDKITDLMASNAKLREALEFYSDSKNYSNKSVGAYQGVPVLSDPDILNDQGSKAKEALPAIPQNQVDSDPRDEEIKRLREALVEAAIPLEALRIGIQAKPYQELGQDIQLAILKSVKSIRAVLGQGGNDEINTHN